jgi:hypothetical protein
MLKRSPRFLPFIELTRSVISPTTSVRILLTMRRIKPRRFLILSEVSGNAGSVADVMIAYFKNHRVVKVPPRGRQVDVGRSDREPSK